MDEWELPKEDFSLEDQLGSGYFADVYRGTWKNRIKVAIKILKNHGELMFEVYNRSDATGMKNPNVAHRVTQMCNVSMMESTSQIPTYIMTEVRGMWRLTNNLKNKYIAVVLPKPQMSKLTLFQEINNTVLSKLTSTF